MERIITNLTDKEIEQLKSSSIDWYVDDIFGNDVVIEGNESDYRKALEIIGRD